MYKYTVTYNTLEGDSRSMDDLGQNSEHNLDADCTNVNSFISTVGL